MSLSDEYDVRKILGVVIIVLVLISVVMYVVMQAPEEKPPVKQPIIPKNQNVNATTNQTKSVYEQKRDELYEECVGDEYIRDKQLCVELRLSEVAQVKLDERYCDMMEDAYRTERCYETVIVQQALAKEDPAICEKFGEPEREVSCKDSYYGDMASRTGNESYCLLISIKEAAAKCHDAMVYHKATQSEDCSILLSGRKRGLCIMYLAEKYDDVSLCETIEHETTRDQCLAAFNKNEN